MIYNAVSQVIAAIGAFLMSDAFYIALFWLIVPWFVTWVALLPWRPVRPIVKIVHLRENRQRRSRDDRAPRDAELRRLQRNDDGDDCDDDKDTDQDFFQHGPSEVF